MKLLQQNQNQLAFNEAKFNERPHSGDPGESGVDSLAAIKDHLNCNTTTQRQLNNANNNNLDAAALFGATSSTRGTGTNIAVNNCLTNLFLYPREFVNVGDKSDKTDYTYFKLFKEKEEQVKLNTGSSKYQNSNSINNGIIDYNQNLLAGDSFFNNKNDQSTLAKEKERDTSITQFMSNPSHSFYSDGASQFNSSNVNNIHSSQKFTEKDSVLHSLKQTMHGKAKMTDQTLANKFNRENNAVSSEQYTTASTQNNNFLQSRSSSTPLNNYSSQTVVSSSNTGPGLNLTQYNINPSSHLINSNPNQNALAGVLSINSILQQLGGQGAGPHTMNAARDAAQSRLQMLQPTYHFNRKYIHQPSYAKAINLVYHQSREIRLDPDCAFQQNLITIDALIDFYQTKGVKLFPNTGRELEVDEEPEALYKYHQADHSTCSESEKRLHQGILSEINTFQKERLSTIPLMYRMVKDTTLFFNSKFESGNLREVEKVNEFEYNLYLNFDFNTLNYTQWYYFSVRNIKKGYAYKFNIMNLQKDDSSYSNGMKPFVYSMTKNREANTNQWQRGCQNPDYEYDEDNIPCYVYEDDESQMATLNTLTFSYTFEYDNDTVFFSHFQPYTYGDLKDYIYSLKKRGTPEFIKNTLRVQKLCDSIQGNTCHVLSITENVYESNMHKQVIFLTSRVHPGESNSSFMIQGAIDFLMQQNNKDAQQLRESFIFKIIPMLNPDGVIKGNYRCNILGVDLNRRWLNPSKLLHPTIYYAKQLAKSCHSDHQIVMFCDMHGHSRKRNVFMYGCVSGQSDMNQHRNNNLIRLIPYLFSQKSKLFCFSDCKFANEKEKESTARLVMFKEFQVMNSYTLESTFYAPLNKQFKKKQAVDEEFQIKAEELVAVGIDLCSTLTQILQSKILKKKFISDLKSGGDTVNGNNIQINIPQPQVLKESTLNSKFNQAQKEREKDKDFQKDKDSSSNALTLTQSNPLKALQSDFTNQNSKADNQATLKRKTQRVGLQAVQQQSEKQVNLVSATQQPLSSQKMIIQQTHNQQSFKQSAAKANVIEPPSQVDAILIDQFVNLGKGKGSLPDYYNRITINNLKSTQQNSQNSNLSALIGLHHSQTPMKKGPKRQQGNTSNQKQQNQSQGQGGMTGAGQNGSHAGGKDGKAGKIGNTSQSQQRPQNMNGAALVGIINSSESNQGITMAQYQNEVFPNIIKKIGHTGKQTQLRRPITTIPATQTQMISSSQTINTSQSKQPSQFQILKQEQQQNLQNQTQSKFGGKVFYQAPHSQNYHEFSGSHQNIHNFSNQLSSINNLDLSYQTAAGQIQQISNSVSPAPKMSNPIIQRALEEEAQTSGGTTNYSSQTKQRKPHSQIYQHGVLGSHRRKIIDKLNSFKMFQQSQQQSLSQIHQQQVNGQGSYTNQSSNQNGNATQSSSILNTSTTLTAINYFFNNQNHNVGSQESLLANGVADLGGVSSQATVIHQGNIAQSVLRHYNQLNSTQPYNIRQIENGQISPKSLNLPNLMNGTKTSHEFNRGSLLPPHPIGQNSIPHHSHHPPLHSHSAVNQATAMNFAYQDGNHTSSSNSNLQIGNLTAPNFGQANSYTFSQICQIGQSNDVASRSAATKTSQIHQITTNQRYEGINGVAKQNLNNKEEFRTVNDDQKTQQTPSHNKV